MAQQDPAAFAPAPAPAGGPVPLAQLAPLAVSNPFPQPAPPCANIIADTGNRLVTATGAGFCIAPAAPTPPPS